MKDAAAGNGSAKQVLDDADLATTVRADDICSQDGRDAARAVWMEKVASTAAPAPGPRSPPRVAANWNADSSPLPPRRVRRARRREGRCRRPAASEAEGRISELLSPPPSSLSYPNA